MRERVSSYEPSVWEAVAESMRLFILNPDLLGVIAPERCEHILKRRLKPLVTEHWADVLRNAPKEYSEQIRKKYL